MATPQKSPHVLQPQRLRQEGRVGRSLAALLQVVCCFVSPFVRRSVDGKTPLRATPQKRLNGMEGGGEIHLQIASSSLCRVLPISAAAMPLCLLLPNVTVVNGDTSSHTGANKRKKRGPSLIPVHRPSSLPYQRWKESPVVRIQIGECGLKLISMESHKFESVQHNFCRSPLKAALTAVAAL